MAGGGRDRMWDIDLISNEVVLLLGKCTNGFGFLGGDMGI